MWDKLDDYSFLLSGGEASSRVMGLVLGLTLQDLDKTGERSEKENNIKGSEKMTCKERVGELGLFSLEKKIWKRA